MTAEILPFDQSKRKKNPEGRDDAGRVKKIEAALFGREGMPKEMSDDLRRILESGAEQMSRVHKLDNETYGEKPNPEPKETIEAPQDGSLKELEHEPETTNLINIGDLSPKVKEKQWERLQKKAAKEEQDKRLEKWKIADAQPLRIKELEEAVPNDDQRAAQEEGDQTLEF